MRKPIAFLGAGVLSLSLLGLNTPVSSAEDPPSPASSSGNVSSVPPTSAAAERLTAETEEYWTADRMESAKPLGLDVAAVRARASRSFETAPTTRGGKKGSVPPAAGPAAGPELATEPLATKPWKARPVPKPYTTQTERTNAKIFFTQNGYAYVCSGTVVNSKTKSMVSTAGHCVSDGQGTWSRNVLVVPAYSSKRAGHRPYGSWVGYGLTARTEWHNRSNILQDYGYIITDPNRRGRIVNTVGGKGTLWNASRNLRWAAYGYPAAYPFSGFSQMKCGANGRIANDDPYFGTAPGPKTIGLACNMKGGASGGGWLTKRDRYQNSLVSYGYYGQGRRFYGPYFGRELKSLFTYTVRQRPA